MDFGQKLFTSLFFCAFLAAGIFFTRQVGKQIVTELATRTWHAVDCTIKSSDIIEKSPYTFAVVYAYVVDGQSYTGTTYYPNYAGSEDYYQAQKILDQFPAGATTKCFVNPRDVQQSSLRQRSLWMAFQVLLPLIFVVVGAGGMYLAWRKTPLPRSNIELRNTRFLGGIICGIFFAIGVGMQGAFLPTLARGHAGQSWPQTSCVIASSSVQSHYSSKSSSYNVAVLFHYTFDGKKYASSRYSLKDVGTSDRAALQRIADSLPKGKETVCYVNPLDPADAVLERSYGSAALLAGIMSLAFMLLGGVGLGAVLHAARNDHRFRMEEHMAAGPRKPADLKAANPAGHVCAGAWIMALLWNGLMACFICVMVSQWHGGSLWTMPNMIVAALTIWGIWILVKAFWLLRTLIHPNPLLHLGEHPILPGEQEETRWEFAGSWQQIQRLKLTVSGYLLLAPVIKPPELEHEPPFWSLDLINTARPMEIRAGRCNFTIPPEAPPAHLAAGVKVAWWAIAAEMHLFSGTDLRLDYPIRLTTGETGAQPVPERR